MAVEGERLVLGEDVDVTKVGVDAVRQGDVDDAVLTCKWDGGLGSIASQGKKPLARATGEQDSKRISHHDEDL